MIRILIGSGRSGTTWLLDSIARQNQLRPVFEPLHPCVSSLSRVYQNILLDKDAPEEELKNYILKSSTGSICPTWTRFRTRPDLLLSGLKPGISQVELRNILYRWMQFTKRLANTYYWRSYQEPFVKLIRANLMVAWISKHIDSRVLYVIRNPFDVVASQLEHIDHWTPDPILEKLYQNQLISDRFAHLKYIAANKSECFTKKLALIWGIQNKIGLEQCRSVGTHIVAYEDLVNNNANSWDTVAFSLDVRLPSRGNLKVASQQTWNKPEGDKKRLSKYDQDCIEGVISQIGLEEYCLHRTA